MTAVLFLYFLSVQYVFHDENSDIKLFQDICEKDLDFIRLKFKKNSAPFANKTDTSHFHKWYKEGYKYSLDFINGIKDKDDCHYVIKYFVNGFDQSHIIERGFIILPIDMYPGIVSAKNGDKHYNF